VTDVRGWLDAGYKRKGDKERRPYGQSTRHGAIVAVKAAFAWGRKKKHIADDPLDELRGPGVEQREGVLDRETIARVMEVARGGFRDMIEFMWETGCRPSEAMRLEAKHLDLTRAVARMESKTTRKTRRLRVIYLNERASEIAATLADRNPKGPIFRGRRGNPWQRHAMAQQWARIRRKLGLGPEGTSEAIRHAFGTDGAFRLKPIVLAELMGHTSTAMVEKHYFHGKQRIVEMQEELAKVRPD
jgi:integrase